MTQMGRQRFDLASCASTSDEAARLARAGAVHGTIVVADAQTQGRGRLGRAWSSPTGGLYLSVVLRLPLPPSDVPGVTLAIGIAVCDAARAFGAAVDLKWPNDVVACGDGRPRKLAGVLVEAQSQGGRVDAVIAGIGVNVRGPVAPEVADRAVALSELVPADAAPSRDELLAVLLPLLETWTDRYVAAGPASIVPAWQARMFPGLRVRVPDRAVEGAALGLGPDGALRVQDDAGVIHFIRSGEAEAVHP